MPTSNAENISLRLYGHLLSLIPDQCSKVLDQKDCDIEPVFLGFVDTYYYLAKIIPKHFTVLDLGCAYAPQSYYFRNHKSYIGVDYSVKEQFHFPNTILRNNRIETEVALWKNIPTEQVFAICNYVPIDSTELRRTFKVLYVFYPSLSLPFLKRGR